MTAIFLHPQRETLGDQLDIVCTRNPIKQRQAIREDSRRESAQQHVFQRGFVRTLVPSQEAHQHVRRDRHQFQADEDEYDVEARRHAHHSDYREQHQGVILAMIFALNFEIPN